MLKILVTGSAGFIGYHVSQLLLRQGHTVVGVDGMTDYYDPRLKQRRHQMLLQNQRFSCIEAYLEDHDSFSSFCLSEQPEVIIHLAAQAGVRYSLENPRSYIDSNLIGTFNVLECARKLSVQHLLMASTSSVYGANEDMPFKETSKADTQLTLYAATKKANESMGHSYSHIYELPTTAFRFFTVYGPWGRPDMALFKFTKAILEGAPIDIYNQGEMWRDFTYVDDIAVAIAHLIDCVPPIPSDSRLPTPGDSLSRVAPFRIVNIGNSQKVRLMDFVRFVELAVGETAKKNYLGMQAGDVPATWADTSLLEALTGFRPRTDVSRGISAFVKWYRDYYDV